MSGIESSNRENKLISENEFIYDGVTYVAQEYDGGCEECAFLGSDCGTMAKLNERPECISSKRSDKRGVIFIKKSERVDKEPESPAQSQAGTVPQSQSPLKGTTTMIDFTKPVQTRDGKPVRILCTDRAHDMFKVAGLVMLENGVELYETWTLEGKFATDGCSSELDLIQVEEKPTPRRHAELIKRWAEDDKMRIKYRRWVGNPWTEIEQPIWVDGWEYEEILPGDPLF